MNSEESAVLKSTLEKAGLKATHQRLAILQILKRSAVHHSAESLFESLKHEHPTISLGTVYRTLEHFVEAGLIHRLKNQHGMLLFDANTQDHHHLYDLNNNQLHDFIDENLNKAIMQYFETHPIPDFEITRLQIQIEGHSKTSNIKNQSDIQPK